jgi:hypothetical protein
LIESRPWILGVDKRVKAGERTDWHQISDLMKQYGPKEGMRLVAEQFPGQFIRYTNGIRAIGNVLEQQAGDKDFKLSSLAGRFLGNSQGPRQQPPYLVDL